MRYVPDSDFIALQEALVGRYSLDREIGRGGMGIVYLAHEVALDRPVALKLLPPTMAAQATLRERFLREALDLYGALPLERVDHMPLLRRVRACATTSAHTTRSTWRWQKCSMRRSARAMSGSRGRSKRGPASPWSPSKPLQLPQPVVHLDDEPVVGWCL
jgi:serine/threonine protein kinase